jgi:hypothetical protein
MDIKIEGKKLGQKKFSRRMAIHKRCLDCSCFHPQAITDCPFKDCQLYLFRTGKGRQDPKERSKSIRDYCLWCMGEQAGEVSKCLSLECSLYPYRKSRVNDNTVSGREINMVIASLVTRRAVGLR